MHAKMNNTKAHYQKDVLFQELFINPPTSSNSFCNKQGNSDGTTPDVDNWNFRFQNIIAYPETTKEEKLLKYSSLNGLNRDFIATASVYAKTIISEYFLPDDLKSVKTKDIGGYAGGKKFVWRGILFKLAYGDQGPYRGNDEAAAKAMGHELKGGNSYFRCCTDDSSAAKISSLCCSGKKNGKGKGGSSGGNVPRLHVALQALIDYKGFRMHAQAELPIDGHNTLLMGTADASQHVYAESSELTAVMKQAGKELNLREHYVKGKLLHAACDIEGHRGYDDRYYVVDLARTFPPEAPDLAPHLWQVEEEKENVSEVVDEEAVLPTSNTLFKNKSEGNVNFKEEYSCHDKVLAGIGVPIAVAVGDIVRVHVGHCNGTYVPTASWIDGRNEDNIRQGCVMEIESDGYVLVLLTNEELPESESGVVSSNFVDNTSGFLDSSNGFVDVNWTDPSFSFGEELSEVNMSVPEIVRVSVNAIAYVNRKPMTNDTSTAPSSDVSAASSSVQYIHVARNTESSVSNASLEDEQVINATQLNEETVMRGKEVVNDVTVNGGDSMSIFWRLLRPEFVKHRGSQLLGEHAVAGKKLTVPRQIRQNDLNDLKVEDALCFDCARGESLHKEEKDEEEEESMCGYQSGRVVDLARGASVVSSLSCGYSDGSFMHNQSLEIELLNNAGLPTRYPALTQVFSLPTTTFTAGIDETNSEHSNTIYSPTIPFAESVFAIEPSTLNDTSYPQLFFHQYSCGDVLQPQSISFNDSTETDWSHKNSDESETAAMNNTANTAGVTTANTATRRNSRQKNQLRHTKDVDEINSALLSDEASLSTHTTSHSQQSTRSTVSLILPSVQVIEQHTQINMDASFPHLAPPLPPVPLSPDALSAFGKTDPKYEECDQDVREATALLVNKLVPAMALDLLTKGHPLRREGLSITEYMHRHGVNIRHMGLLRWHLFQLQTGSGCKDVVKDMTVSWRDETDKSGCNDCNRGGNTTDKLLNASNYDDVTCLQTELLLECISRTLKNLLRKTQRQWMCNGRTSSEEGMMTVVVNFLNLITAAHPAAADFWTVLVIPGIYERFGRVALSAAEALPTPAPVSSSKRVGCVDVERGNEKEKEDVRQLPMLFTHQCTDADIRLLLQRMCRRGGIQLHPECLEHLHEGPAKGFEFAVSDIVELIPVVKHMHQVDLGEGLMLSLMSQDLETSTSTSTDSTNYADSKYGNGSGGCRISASAASSYIDISMRQNKRSVTSQSQSVRMRLMTLSVDKLHAALKAVPDDRTTKQALADAYQGLAFASLADATVSLNPLTDSSADDTSFNRNGIDSKPSSNSCSGSMLTRNCSHKSSIFHAKSTGKSRYQYITERGFELYRSLLWEDEHTKCAKLGISYEEDILGVCLLITHFPFDKYLNSGEGRRRRSSSGSGSVSEIDIQRIKDVKVGQECVSLRYFRMYVAYHTSLQQNNQAATLPPSTADTTSTLSSTSGRAKQKSHRPLSCWRFFPLIVDPQHAHRAKELLTHEMILADRVSDKMYSYAHLQQQQQLEEKEKEKEEGSLRVPLTAGQKALFASSTSVSTKNVTPFKLPTVAINNILPKISSKITLRVISAVMNSLVLQFVDDAQNNGKISDSALVGFIRFHHMLLFLGHESPDIKNEANVCVESFVQDSTHRTKEGTSNLGSFLVYVLLSDRGWDEALRYAFLQETLRRQVAWFITKGGQKYSLLVLESDDVSLYRLQTTFQQTLKSLRLIMFQVYFLQTIARSGQATIANNAPTSNPTPCSTPSTTQIPQPQQAAAVVLHLYNASLGRPTAAMRNDYKSQFEEIMHISNYGDYLQRIGCCHSPHQFTVMLRNAIRSCTHASYGPIPLSSLVGPTALETVPASSSGWSWHDCKKHALSHSDLAQKGRKLFEQWQHEADTSICNKNYLQRHSNSRRNSSSIGASDSSIETHSSGSGRNNNRKDVDAGTWGRQMAIVCADTSGDKSHAMDTQRRGGQHKRPDRNNQNSQKNSYTCSNTSVNSIGHKNLHADTAYAVNRKYDPADCGLLSATPTKRCAKRANAGRGRQNILKSSSMTVPNQPVSMRSAATFSNGVERTHAGFGAKKAYPSDKAAYSESNRSSRRTPSASDNDSNGWQQVKGRRVCVKK